LQNHPHRRLQELTVQALMTKSQALLPGEAVKKLSGNNDCEVFV